MHFSPQSQVEPGSSRFLQQTKTKTHHHFVKLVLNYSNDGNDESSCHRHEKTTRL